MLFENVFYKFESGTVLVDCFVGLKKLDQFFSKMHMVGSMLYFAITQGNSHQKTFSFNLYRPFKYSMYNFSSKAHTFYLFQIH